MVSLCSREAQAYRINCPDYIVADKQSVRITDSRAEWLFCYNTVFMPLRPVLFRLVSPVSRLMMVLVVYLGTRQGTGVHAAV